MKKKMLLRIIESKKKKSRRKGDIQRKFWEKYARKTKIIIIKIG